MLYSDQLLVSFGAPDSPVVDAAGCASLLLRAACAVPDLAAGFASRSVDEVLAADLAGAVAEP